MLKEIATGTSDFCKIRERNNFLVDKTLFIKEWWNKADEVTLITRPRRFGKTLNMSMLECFFSTDYKNRSDLFEGLKISEYPEIMKFQGTIPVIALSFSTVKNDKVFEMKNNIASIIKIHYIRNNEIVHGSDKISEDYKKEYDRIKNGFTVKEPKDFDENLVAKSVLFLSEVLSIEYGKKVIILLDEYDTPLQEAWTQGSWNEILSFMRLLFTSTFKDNKFMDRAVMTGITRVSKESLFSGMNNLLICSLSNEIYQDYFGFTEQEVFDAMDEYGYTNKDEIKFWYDGFNIGRLTDIYNPMSVTFFLNSGKIDSYWANSSSNDLVSKLIRQGSKDIKSDFENLLNGGSVTKKLDEQLVFNKLSTSQSAIWSLLVMSGYLKSNLIRDKLYEIRIVNHETMLLLRNLIEGWFDETVVGYYSDFIKSFLNCDTDSMNEYMNRIVFSSISTFDSAYNEDDFLAPEKFYHGLVLGMLVELRERYAVKSNRESGFGRYDIMLVPHDKKDRAFIIEFKVVNKNKKETLETALTNALAQIEEKKYEQELLDLGATDDNIIKYGFAFEGKKVLIGQG
ncbi:AAA family ATPase [Ruminococcus sp. HUN007]|uniref:AAA family ATPase n=1 Tax=Ruminococcus sp. HUN007 TaxID=1514668 RepID=UPI0005D2092D|nr:AAA family ATPase [Ruminococcus sp. HUN007]